MHGIFPSLSIVAIIWFACISAEDKPCAYLNGVCVCNETYCDSFDFIRPTTTRAFKIVTSSEAGKRYQQSSGQLNTLPAPSSSFSLIVTLLNFLFGPSEANLQIDRTVQFQQMIGFGGAVTGSVQYLYNEMTPAIRTALIKSYFLSSGNDYNMIRTSMGGSDFDLTIYAYDEGYPGDKDLIYFNELDPNWSKAMNLKDVLNKIFEVKAKEKIKLFAAAWSPPTWMKTCEAWSGPCLLKPEYYQTWANYHLRYLELMNNSGINFYAISTGNEPSLGIVGWLLKDIMCLGWDAINQGKWVKENLGPTLRNSTFSGVKILAGDDQRFEMPTYFQGMVTGAFDVMDFIDIFGVHWYWDDKLPASLLDTTHNIFPDKIILNTESCIGDQPSDVHGPVLGSWDRAQKYISAYIQDFSHWVSGWIDWNLFLNEQGGPANIDNPVDAAIIVNETSQTEFYKQPMFYAIGHFSKFIPPGAIRIASTLSSGLISSSDIEVVAFLCPDGTVTVILHNTSNDVKQIKLIDLQKGWVKLSLEANSVSSFVYV